MRAWLKAADPLARRRLAQAVALLSGFVVLIGCMSKPKSREDETTTDMRHIARVFDSLQSFQNRPPKDMDEIRQWLSDLHKDKQNDEPDKVLTSSRDNQPYVIVLGARMGSEPMDALIIFEKTGADGTRYAMNAGRQVSQLTEEEFRQAKIAAGKRSDEGN